MTSFSRLCTIDTYYIVVLTFYLIENIVRYYANLCGCFSRF